MRNKLYLTSLLLICFTVSVFGQIEKEFNYRYELPASKSLDLKLKFAKLIEVQTWDEAQLGLTVIMKMDDESRVRLHEMDVDQSGDRLSIETGFDSDAIRDKREYSCWSCDEDARKECVCLSVRYRLFVPRGAELNLETISGDIDVKSFEGPLKLESISGFIDVALGESRPVDLKIDSVTGEIYTDLDIPSGGDMKSFSKSLRVALNGGGQPLSLETVSGDIFLRRNNSRR